MRYLLVGHSTAARNDGVGNYSRAVLGRLRGWGVDPAFVSRDADVSLDRYREVVRDTVVARFRPGEVFVESPEINAPSLLLPDDYRVHVRLHCPKAFVSVHNGQAVDWARFQQEMEVVRRAHAVSSPSYALLDLLRPHVDVSRIHVYKNPPPPGLTPVDPAARTHDVVFLGRFRRVKGVDFLDPVLRALPSSYSVVLAGRGLEALELSSSIRCRVRVVGEVESQERDRLVGGARVAMVLSRFENCSMVVLEALATGTVVVGWDVGGHREIAGPDLVRLVPLGDTDALAATIVASVEGAAPAPEAFRAATDRAVDDFRCGWSHVWEAARRGSESGVYRGLNCRTEGSAPPVGDRSGVPPRADPAAR